MGLSRALPITCALLVLIIANTASAGGRNWLLCFTDKLKNGLRRDPPEENTLPIQVPAQFRATDEELAKSFRGNAQYQTLSQLFSGKLLRRFRNSPETHAIRDALVKGGNFRLNTGKIFVYGTVSRTSDSLNVEINNIKSVGNDTYRGYNTETNALKTGLAKIFIGIYEATHAIAIHHPEVTHLKIVADEIMHTKLGQSLSQMGFYSKKAGRRLTDEEVKAVAVNYWIKLKNTMHGDSIEPKEFSTYIDLELNARIDRASESPRSVQFQLSDLRPMGDPSEEATRNALSNAGYGQRDINAILRVLSRRLTPKEELLYQEFVKTGRI